jgi:hypothetical protein
MAEVAINWLAVLLATIVCFVLGALWFGPLFGKPWMRSLGIDPAAAQQSAKKGMGRMLSITFILEWIMAMCLAYFIGFIGSETDAVHGMLYGFLTGLPWVGFAITVNSLYESKPMAYIFITGGYWTVAFTLMGLILGAWH